MPFPLLALLLVLLIVAVLLAIYFLLYREALALTSGRCARLLCNFALNGAARGGR